MTALAEHRAAAVASVTDSFIDLQRTVRQSKARLLAAAGTDVESATHLLTRFTTAYDQTHSRWMQNAMRRPNDSEEGATV